MDSILNLSPQQLRRAADLQERIQSLQEEVSQLLGTPAAVQDGGVGTPKRRMSAAGRARIAAAARARWARYRQKTGPSPTPKRRKLSAQGLANIRAGVAKRMAAKKKAAKGEGVKGSRPKRKLSPEAKARLAAVARERWRKIKAAGKTSL